MDFQPQNYTLSFIPDFEKFTYTGHEIFTFTTTSVITSLTLDAVGIDISACYLQNNPAITVTSIRNETKSTLTFAFSQPLSKGTYALDFSFSAAFSQGLAGWYISRYEEKKQMKYIATTHFEPADARTVFPCVDHPAFKATFTISVLIDAQLKAISNMPIKSTTEKDGKQLVSFEETPKMSTYLLYLGVGEFAWRQSYYHKTLIRGIATPGREKYTEFAIEWTKKCLAYFEEYFGTPYALPKVDLLAIPDFAAGAMENWGAITFRENLLLYYENVSSIATKQAVAEVVAHELAHQWFGNLVTMKWWNDLWLNESFATFMAYKVVDHFYPQWHIWSDYITNMVFGGMELDALHSSHPIQVVIEDVSQINELFDEIAYDKGGSILRMLEEYVGKDIFRDGLRIYIKTYAYKNTQGKDLWNTLQHISHKQIDSLMESFIVQRGFPLIHVSSLKKTVKITQQQFVYTPEDKQKIWTIPLVLDTGNEIQKHLIQEPTQSLPQTQTPLFINANKHYSGFYITAYAPPLLQALGSHLEKTDYTDRLGIVHDQYALTLTNKYTLNDFSHFIHTYFNQENDPSVLNYCIGKLAKSYLMVQNEEEKNLTITLATRALGVTGYIPQAQENPHRNYLRNSALYALSLFDDKQTKKFTLDTFKKSLIDKTSLHPDIKGTIYALAVWSDDTYYATVLSQYHATEVQEEKAKYLSALGNSKNKKLLSDTLEFCLTPDVRFAHILYVISGISRNPHGRELVIDWLFKNWEKLLSSGTGMHMIMRHMLKMIIPICGINKQDEVQAFLLKQHLPTLEKTFAQIAEELAINCAFVKNNKQIP